MFVYVSVELATEGHADDGKQGLDARGAESGLRGYAGLLRRLSSAPCVWPLLHERLINRAHALLLIASLLVMGVRPSQAQFENVGSFEFPTSASGEVQHHFRPAAALLHSFGWLQAIGELHVAQEIDPDFEMPYWRESLTYNHPLNSRMDPTEPRRVLERLAPTRVERLAKASTKMTPCDTVSRHCREGKKSDGACTAL